MKTTTDSNLSHVTSSAILTGCRMFLDKDILLSKGCVRFFFQDKDMLV